MKIPALALSIALALGAVPAIAASPARRPVQPITPAHAEWTTDTKGAPKDRVNGYIVGTLDEVRAVFASAGWSEATPLSARANLKYLGAVTRHEAARGLRALTRGRLELATPKADAAIQRMPVSKQLVDGAAAVTAFEKDNHPFGGRHHFRVFSTGRLTSGGRPIWAIAASRDVKLVFSPKHPGTLFTNHVVDDDADKERNKVEREAVRTGDIAKVGYVQQQPDPVTHTETYSRDGRVFYLVVKKAATF